MSDICYLIMKLYLIFALLFSVVYNDCDGTNGSKASDCNGKLSENEKNSYARCCFIKAGSEKGCVALTQKEFNDIDATIKSFKDEEKKDIDDLDCLSIYLKLGLLSILFLLF